MRQHLLPGYYSTLPFPVQFTSPFVFNMFKIAKKEPPPAGEGSWISTDSIAPCFLQGFILENVLVVDIVDSEMLLGRPGSPLFQYQR